jgi:hypothetical protein
MGRYTRAYPDDVLKQLAATFEHRDGALYYKIVPWHNVKVGDRADHSNGDMIYQYRRVGMRVDGKRTYFMAHAVILFLTTGVWPAGRQIDHITGPSNLPSNLRAATCSQQRQNSKLYSNNTSGHKGVYFRPHAKKNPYMVSISADNRSYWGGVHPTFEAAVAARRILERALHGKFARRRNRSG